MDSAKFTMDLSGALSDACRGCLEKIKEEMHGQKVYAYAIYCDSGCVRMGVAFSTLETLAQKNGSLDPNSVQAIVNMMNAAEWGYVNFHHEIFGKVNKMIDDFYDCLFDGEFDDVKFDDSVKTAELQNFANEIFVKAMAVALRDVRGAISGDHGFTEDVFLGVQFGDPGQTGADMMEAISSKLNSKTWDDRVKINCAHLRDRAQR